MLANYTSPFDADVVDRLARAGTVLLGKTNMDEFAMGSSSETSHFGPVRTRGSSTACRAAARAARPRRSPRASPRAAPAPTPVDRYASRRRCRACAD
jgi:aspartyl-tRNA(Asn)/glutamyl-tRNA(Gln) amidotransferase subunit A